jgi:N-acetylglutamate synthase-like GNAT family acetyltransferase|tara:strand:- start:844 stop:1290 length:447 start_codon:yes stop_codon:yes gene_type:complete
MIRDATLKDIPELIEFLKPFHDEGGYMDISIDAKVMKINLQNMLSSPMHKIWVVERDGEICASLGVVSTEIWYSKRHYATNLFLCSNNKGKGSAGFLLRKFKKWCDSRPIIRDVTLGITSEIGDIKRVEQLYQAIGFKRLGGLFRLKI